MSSIKVFVVDDSAVARTYLSDALTAGGLQVVGTAADPIFAWPRMQAVWPDVIVLDVVMPRMDGLTFLRKLMSERPTPVVMCSVFTERGGQTSLDALAAGAVSVVTKPAQGLRQFLLDHGRDLVASVRAAARANLRSLRGIAMASAPPPPKRPSLPLETRERVVAIGISTGGVQAVEGLLRQLDRSTPGIVLVQHMPEHFTASFAARLNDICELEVLEAQDGDPVIKGRVLIAPGGRHMSLRRSGAQYCVEVRDGPFINYHRPSVDVLFRSVAACAGRHAVGLIMTGMGNDGARGLREMRNAGAYTAAQDEASCVVFGMPAEAIKLGAADDVVPLDGMAVWLQQTVARPLRG